MVNGLGYSIIGNTSDFGSEITGSSPVSPTILRNVPKMLMYLYEKIYFFNGRSYAFRLM